MEAACATYARCIQLAINDAKSSGWNELDLNQNVYFGYYNIQYPYRKLTHYGNKNELFLISFSKETWAVPKKSYLRWVTWRYIKLSGFFSN